MDPHPATVTQVSPLRVMLDGAATDSPALHFSAVYAPVLDDRVAVVAYDSRLLVLGVPS